MGQDKTIGLALGGGGARGMAHILVCEAFDELGLKPAVIAGTSIGAIIGVGYASGLSGREMRERAVAFYARRREVLSKLWRARPLAFSDLLRGRLLAAQFDPELILSTFVPGYDDLPATFEELAIPLRIVATDFYGWTETVLESGPLAPAIAASIAIPSLFRPVLVNGRVQIDGGCYNPLPFDLVDEAELVVACDVAGGPAGEPNRCPGLLETIVGAAQLSMQAIVAEKLKWQQPDILVRPEINGIFVLDFLKTEAILDMNAGFKDDLKRRLDQAVNTPFEEALARGATAALPLAS
ncbi:MAG TPA: patatin-like phospholipase family protein [Afifellaceae bacterium]|nr:patatin-like phospholipase family protein [Afifellaceae bacterium]